MLTEHLFARDETLPSWWANAVDQVLSTLANLPLTLTDSTHITVSAGSQELASVVSIGGKWRWLEAPITRAHPGGGAGTYGLFVTCANNSIVSTPDPFTDATNYAFDFVILPPATTPSIVGGTVDFFRKVGTCEWSGTAITRIDQSMPRTALHRHQHATGQPDALTALDIGALAPWNYRVGGGTAVDGDYWTVGGGQSVALPTPTVGRMVVVEGNGVTGTSQATVTSSAGIYTRGAWTGATSVKIGTPGAVLIFFADGALWHVMAGEQDTGPVHLLNHSSVTGVATVRLKGDQLFYSGVLTNATGGTLTSADVVAGAGVVATRPATDQVILAAMSNGGILGVVPLSITAAGGVLLLPGYNWLNGETLSLNGWCPST